MKNPDGAIERAALVQLRPDGRWEVQVSENEGTDGARRWQHKAMFRTEQEAEQYARSLLPYCDTAWASRRGQLDDEPSSRLRVQLSERDQQLRSDREGE